MREALGVDVVDTLEHLLEEVTADGLSEGARVGNVVEKLTSWDHFLSDVGNLDLLSTLLVPNCVLLEFKVFDDVLVVELGGGIDLLLQELEGLVIEVRVVQAEDFQGVLRAILGSSELNLGGEAGSESLAEGESVDS